MQTPRTSRTDISTDPLPPVVPGDSTTDDESGAIAIYVALMLPFLVGLALLVVDGGRLFNLDTSLQNNVDALALAGAAELDRRPDAHVRACRSMQNLVSNKQIFVNSNAQLDVACDSNGNPLAGSDVGWCWLKTLPADHCKIDLSDSCQKNSTSSGTDCAYDLSTAPETSFYLQVKSRVQAAGFSAIMPVAIVKGQAPASLRRSAVAGMAHVVCQPTPLMICNPWEAQGIDTVAELRSKIGTLTTAREYGGGSAPIGPGEFGLLDPSEVFDTCTNSGGIVSTLTWQMAGGAAASCNVQNGLCPKTGVIAKLDDAVNTRFDIYKGSMGSYLSQNPTALVPAARTIWNSLDRSADACAATTQKELAEVANGVWYPRDTNWDRVAYFSQYSAQFPGLNTTSAMVTLPGNKQKQLGALTRYETYQWEAAQAAISTSASKPYTFTKPADRTCFAQKVNNGTTLLNQLGISGRLKRRDIYGSIANCLEIKAAIAAGAPYSLNGSSTTLPLPALATAKFFISEPVNRTYRDYSPNKPPEVKTSEGGKAAWPQDTCPSQFSHHYWIDIGSYLEQGTTYFFKVQVDSSTTVWLDPTLSATDPATVPALVSALTQSAAEKNITDKIHFCSKLNSSYLFFEANIDSATGNAFDMQLSVTNANKRIFLELVDVYAADNGADVTRDVVRLYR